MNSNLNEALIAEKYPEFTNRMFDSLLVPFGIIKTKNNNVKKYDNYDDVQATECIDISVYDTLFDLAKFKLPKRYTRKKTLASPNTQKTQKTQKNAKKREKIITQYHSIF